MLNLHEDPRGCQQEGHVARELRCTSSDPTDSSHCSCVGSAQVGGWREVASSLPMGAEVWVAVRTPVIGLARLNVILSPCA